MPEKYLILIECLGEKDMAKNKINGKEKSKNL
jgi:hypothetical protein